MYSSKRLAISIISLAAIAIISTAAWAKSINLLAEPKDGAPVTATVDLATGIIPIYTPENSEWIKIADPRNGNTGWIKRSQLTDSQGNVLTVQQNVKDSKDGKSQSMEMTYGNQNLTPEQKKKLEAQQQGAKAATQFMQQNLEEVKKLYMQQLEMMQKSGLPVMTPPPAQAPVNQPVPPVNQ